MKERLPLIADIAILTALRNPLLEKVKGIISEECLLREYKTIKLDIGRRTGKTTYIKTKLLDLADVGVPSFVICFNDSVYQHTWKGYDNVFTIHDYQNRLRGKRFMGCAIFVDDASYCFSDINHLDEFYKNVAVLEPTFILMLG